MIKNALEKPRRGGRPSKNRTGDIEEKIFTTAATLFLHHGYGAVSIEQIARQAQISKRTFYARYENKESLFRAVVRGIIAKLHPTGADATRLFEGAHTEEVLRRIAPIILHAALTPDGLALHRIVLAEATRFPELAMIMNQQGLRQEAINLIGDLLQKGAQASDKKIANPAFAAEQFLQMITAAPQRRAMGLGKPMTAMELDKWAQDTVTLFINGAFS